MVYGLCGFLSIIIVISCIFGGYYFSSNFDWSVNWLSDIGGADEVGRSDTSTNFGSFLFNNGLIASGLFGLVFSIGLIKTQGINRIGGWLLTVSTLILVFIGLFPGSGPLHTELTIMFFVISLLSMGFIGFGLIRNKQRLGWFVIFLWIIAIPNALSIFILSAIPEFVTVIILSLWIVMIDFHYLKINGLSQV